MHMHMYIHMHMHMHTYIHTFKKQLVPGDALNGAEHVAGDREAFAEGT